MKVAKIEPISNDVLDKLKERYENDKRYRINDHDSHGDRYFLISRGYTLDGENEKLQLPPEDTTEFKFIWIGGGLWQFSYCNPACSDKLLWKSPLEILNKLIKDL